MTLVYRRLNKEIKTVTDRMILIMFRINLCNEVSTNFILSAANEMIDFMKANLAMLGNIAVEYSQLWPLQHVKLCISCFSTPDPCVCTRTVLNVSTSVTAWYTYRAVNWSWECSSCDDKSSPHKLRYWGSLHLWCILHEQAPLISDNVLKSSVQWLCYLEMYHTSIFEVIKYACPGEVAVYHARSSDKLWHAVFCLGQHDS